MTAFVGTTVALLTPVLRVYSLLMYCVLLPFTGRKSGKFFHFSPAARILRGKQSHEFSGGFRGGCPRRGLGETLNSVAICAGLLLDRVQHHDLTIQRRQWVLSFA